MKAVRQHSARAQTPRRVEAPSTIIATSRAVTRQGGSLPAFVVRWRAMPYAYVNECQHQSTELDWNAGDFFDESKLYLMCATHGALYDPGSGLCVSGPCHGARLAPVKVCERGGGIFCAEDG